MAYCKSCGMEISDNAVSCPKCGAPGPGQDKGGILWGLLGCCIPIVGLILFLVWKNDKPKTAKAAGIGALVSVIIAVLYYIIVFVALAGLGTAVYY